MGTSSGRCGMDLARIYKESVEQSHDNVAQSSSFGVGSFFMQKSHEKSHENLRATIHAEKGNQTDKFESCHSDYRENLAKTGKARNC